jgi:hypothetical protein
MNAQAPITAQDMAATRRDDLAERVQRILRTAGAMDQVAVLFDVLRGNVDVNVASMLDDLEGIHNTRGYSGLTKDFLGHAEYLSIAAEKMLHEAEDAQ